MEVGYHGMSGTEHRCYPVITAISCLLLTMYMAKARRVSSCMTIWNIRSADRRASHGTSVGGIG